MILSTEFTSQRLYGYHRDHSTSNLRISTNKIPSTDRKHAISCSSQESKETFEPRRRDLIISSVVGASLSGIDVSLAKDLDSSNVLVPKGQSIAPGLIPSAVIKGCWQLSGGHKGDGDTDRTYGKAALDDFDVFVRAGITTFDTADIYGPSESIIGQYVQKHGREGLQIFTKHCVFSQKDLRFPSLDSVERSIDRSLSNLKVPSLDLVQFYWNDYGQPNFVETALYLAELQAMGKISNIGVTNFDTRRLKAIIDSGVKVVSSQVQYSLLDRRVENLHSDFCKANNIKILPFGVLAGSFLTDRYVGMSFEEAQKKVKVDTYSKSKYLSVLSNVGGWASLQRLLSVLKTIGDKYSTSVANVASRWTLQQPQVASIIIGARNSLHVDDHKKIFSFTLDDSDLGLIQEVLDSLPRPKGDIYDWERGGSF